LLFEVQELCKHVAILNKGQVVIEDTMHKVAEGMTGKPKIVVRIAGEIAPAIEALKNGGFAELEVHGQVIDIYIHSEQKAQVLKLLTLANIDVEDFRTEDGNLEDAFMEFIGEGSIPGGEIHGN